MVASRPLYKKNHLLLAEMMRNGYTIRSLADAIGVHYLTIWRIANREHRPTVKTAELIAERLGCRPQTLDLNPWGGKGRARQAESERPEKSP